jgi:hypothetical protein
MTVSIGPEDTIVQIGKLLKSMRHEFVVGISNGQRERMVEKVGSFEYHQGDNFIRM